MGVDKKKDSGFFLLARGGGRGLTDVESGRKAGEHSGHALNGIADDAQRLLDGGGAEDERRHRRRRREDDGVEGALASLQRRRLVDVVHRRDQRVRLGLFLLRQEPSSKKSTSGLLLDGIRSSTDHLWWIFSITDPKVGKSRCKLKRKQHRRLVKWKYLKIQP